ncbi:hypothetical protein AB6A40_002782 [Gnathostoma spinigerum]|uniref:Uncharacterized protein n=1 Tax=Gnathostoma spinigerum TaxID=75299 RepID=A0ABD6E7K9_9BILA
MVKLAVIFILSIIIRVSSYDFTDTCIDGPFCAGSCNEEGMPLECPLKCTVCKGIQMTPEEEKVIDDRKQDYQCEGGWSKIKGNKITEWGGMKAMAGRVDFTNVTGKAMYIYGYNYGAPAYVYFESKEKPGVVLFYMGLDLPNRRIKLSKRKDGRWSSYAVVSIALQCCARKLLPRIHFYWMIQLSFGLRNERQFIDIFDWTENKRIYRFYPDEAVKKDDRYYFNQTGYNVLSATWSNNGIMTFPSGLPVDSEIQVFGQIQREHVTIALTKKNGDISAIIIFRRPRKRITEVELTTHKSIERGGCDDNCYFADFNDNDFSVITIRRTSTGLQVWHKGFLYATANNTHIKDDAVERIEVMSGFRTKSRNHQGKKGRSLPQPAIQYTAVSYSYGVYRWIIPIAHSAK